MLVFGITDCHFKPFYSCQRNMQYVKVCTYEQANATRAPLTTIKSRMFHRSRK